MRHHPKKWEDTPARKANRDRIKGIDYSRSVIPPDGARVPHSWFRVYNEDGTYEDIAATMAQSTGYQMKKKAYELYDGIDVKAVVVLNRDKSRVLWSVRNMPKRPLGGGSNA